VDVLPTLYFDITILQNLLLHSAVFPILYFNENKPFRSPEQFYNNHPPPQQAALHSDFSMNRYQDGAHLINSQIISRDINKCKTTGQSRGTSEFR
jgi:hypothetical protein